MYVEYEDYTKWGGDVFGQEISAGTKNATVVPYRVVKKRTPVRDAGMLPHDMEKISNWAKERNLEEERKEE